MIIKKVDKKKLYINIAALIVVFGLIAYLLLNSFSFSSSEKTNETITDEVSMNIRIEQKYSSLKKINLELFDEGKYKNLREPRRPNRPKLEKGNLNPFEGEVEE